MKQLYPSLKKKRSCLAPRLLQVRPTVRRARRDWGRAPGISPELSAAQLMCCKCSLLHTEKAR